MNLIITIDLDNDAFKGDPANAHMNIIATIRDGLDNIRHGRNIRPCSIELIDRNGNTCGTVKLVEGDTRDVEHGTVEWFIGELGSYPPDADIRLVDGSIPKPDEQTPMNVTLVDEEVLR